MGPKLIGQDPTQLKVINRFMDYELKGHPYVKSPIDMACWDILGKVGIVFENLYSWLNLIPYLIMLLFLWHCFCFSILGFWFAGRNLTWRVSTRKYSTLPSY